MNELQEMKSRHEKLTIKLENLRTKLAPFEAALECPEVIAQGREREACEQYNEKKREFDSLDLQVLTLSRKIYRREQLVNHKSLMAGYIESMTTWKSDEEELQEKRCSISTRLEQVRQQAHDDMAKARQAETEAATAYAQAVAWGDVDGEKNASSDAEKAAKKLCTATEHNRRQELIITALEQELIAIDKHIIEAKKEYEAIEKKAAHLAYTVLEEKWNEAAIALLDVGGKLWAAQRLINRDSLALYKLNIPQQGENFWSWTSSELAERSYKHSLQDVLTM